MRIRQHVNPLKSNFFVIRPDPVPLPVGVPVEVELGSAEAWYLMDRARAEPNAIYVGVEIRRDMVEKARADCAAAGLSQVHNVFANMSVDLPRLFPPGRVRRFFLNFPDPFFKRTQHKRRAMSPELIETVHALLEPGGEMHVNTDIFELGLDAMYELEREVPRRLFENMRAPWSFLPSPAFAARSRRDLQCTAEGVRVWRLAYRKT